MRKTGGQGVSMMYVQMQNTDKAAVDRRPPAFAHASSCAVVQGIASQLKGTSEELTRKSSPV